jgi:DNA segregation ATPase FtsK/SpoIIIE-like protein
METTDPTHIGPMPSSIRVDRQETSLSLSPEDDGSASSLSMTHQDSMHNMAMVIPTHRDAQTSMRQCENVSTSIVCPDSRRLLVAHLPSWVTAAELLTMFAQFGSVEGVKLVYNQRTGRCRGFAFVKFAVLAAAEAATAALDGTKVGDRVICVRPATVKVRQAGAINSKPHAQPQPRVQQPQASLSPQSSLSSSAKRSAAASLFASSCEVSLQLDGATATIVPPTGRMPLPHPANEVLSAAPPQLVMGPHQPSFAPQQPQYVFAHAAPAGQVNWSAQGPVMHQHPLPYPSSVFGNGVLVVAHVPTQNLSFAPSSIGIRHHHAEHAEPLLSPTRAMHDVVPSVQPQAMLQPLTTEPPPTVYWRQSCEQPQPHHPHMDALPLMIPFAQYEHYQPQFLQQQQQPQFLQQQQAQYLQQQQQHQQQPQYLQQQQQPQFLQQQQQHQQQPQFLQQQQQHQQQPQFLQQQQQLYNGLPVLFHAYDM